VPFASLADVSWWGRREAALVEAASGIEIRSMEAWTQPAHRPRRLRRRRRGAPQAAEASARVRDAGLVLLAADAFGTARGWSTCA
jgi:hypothetical protein